MIAYVKGILTDISDDTVIVETGGIGVRICVPTSVISSLPHIGEEVMIYTYFKVSEDAMTLYGFNSKKDMDMFASLISISGIGPKGALSILSTMSPDELRIAILSSDDKAISRSPGIGSKTAQRIIIDLKDKISDKDIISMDTSNLSAISSGLDDMTSEAIEALISLGYSSHIAMRAVREVSSDSDNDNDAQKILKAALKKLAFI